MRKREVIEPRKVQQIEVDTLFMVADNNMQTIMARMHSFYRGLRARRVSNSCIYHTREILCVPRMRYTCKQDSETSRHVNDTQEVG